MRKLKIAYFGTPDFAADFLEGLLTDSDIPVEVVLVVTQPDKRAGRERLLTESPVKSIAKKHAISTVTLTHGYIDNNVAMEQFSNVDVALVYAFGEILPKKLLEIPPYGFWNIHPSLLPKYRGPSPIATPLINGDTETGVTLMQMDSEMDHGPIIAQEKVAIGEYDKRPDMEKKLTEAGYELFKQEVKNIGIKELKMREQNHSQATYTKRLTKDDGYIESSQFTVHSSQEAREIFNKFRGLYPWPGIWTKIRAKSKEQSEKSQERRLKITDMDLVDGRLAIKKVQLEGKREVDFETFKRAYEW